MIDEYKTKVQFDDGPYVFVEKDRWLIRWIKEGIAAKKYLSADNLRDFMNKSGYAFDARCLSYDWKDRIEEFEITDVANLAVASDIHGQYDILVKILRSHGIIDDHNQWNYADGHLVILGDVFDRGDRVLECLWLIYQLEQQAEQCGGQVHLILGNHELMVLRGDHRYMHEKYVTTERLLRQSYGDLFSEESVLGQWLRTKPAILAINDILFVHAGISPVLVKERFTISEINRIYTDLLKTKKRKTVTEKASRQYWIEGVDGPVWYRGYFYDANFNGAEMQKILKYFGKKCMVVGHTTMPQIQFYFDKQLIAVDSGIKWGTGVGEILLVEEDQLFAGDAYGSRRML